MSETPEREIDKSTWGEGPWQSEPDRAEWEHAGLPCLAARSAGVSGSWCGYVAVPPGHPLHGKAYQDVDGQVSVHGGLTYSDACQGHICHVPKPGEPDDVWWFGFDCGHAFDLSPALRARLKDLGLPGVGDERGETYRTLDYVRNEVNVLAEQLAALGRRVHSLSEYKRRKAQGALVWMETDKPGEKETDE